VPALGKAGVVAHLLGKIAKLKGINAGQKGLRHSTHNMFVFSGRIFDQGWFAQYTF
jgi:hypothetical protein